MSLLVVDASVLTAFYIADDPRQQDTAKRLSAGDAMFAPAHFDAEIASALRGLARNSSEVARAVPAALRHLAHLPVRRFPLSGLLERMWELRHNMTVYDAAYVALAEQLEAPLLTCDAKLAASGGRCHFEVIG